MSRRAPAPCSISPYGPGDGGMRLGRLRTLRTDARVTTDSSGTSTVDITFKGDTVDPEGAKVEVKAGDPLKLHITADKPGEIHVHSSPEQELEYSAGTTDKTLTLDQPGVVEVESHSLDKLILQLEVR